MPARNTVPPNASPSPPKFTARLLVVDDEPIIRAALAEFLEHEGFVVDHVGTFREALHHAKDERVDVALCDIQLPDGDGVDLVQKLLQLNPETFVMLITAYGTVESAVAAFKRGAHDYLLKPLRFDEVLARIRNLLRFRELARENQWLRRELNRSFAADQIVGRGPAMQAVFATVAKVAPTNSNVLILGESGTGKELIARALHQQSPCHEERFLAVNCAAIPAELLENQLFGHRRGAYTGADRDMDGLFVRAGAGTLFLDEIGEMNLATQAKLLRAIEQKEILPVGANEPVRIQARIVAATNKDLGKEVAQGRFREDLYYRLNVVTIALPPLRERREDLPELIEFLLAKQARNLGKRFLGVERDALQVLLTAPWKGNVRELENVLQRAVILGDGPLVRRQDLPPGLVPDEDIAPGEDLREAVAHFERRHIERILRLSPDKKEAARRLGLALSSLYRKIEELGLRADDPG
jgi:DNA-binding NtrC family response regulator